MRKIRINSFETNSSSTHSLTVENKSKELKTKKYSYNSNRGNKILYYNKYDNQFLLFDVLKKKETFFKIKSKEITKDIIEKIFIKNFTFIKDDNYKWRNIKNEINIKYFPILQLIYYKYKYGRIKNKRFK